MKEETVADRAVRNPWHRDTNWAIVQHRIEYSKENQLPCNCKLVCQPYLAALQELRSKGEIQ